MRILFDIGCVAFGTLVGFITASLMTAASKSDDFTDLHNHISELEEKINDLNRIGK